MSQLSLIEVEQEYYTILQKSGMMQNGKLYQQEMLGRSTSENECGSLHTPNKYPTPVARDFRDNYTALRSRIGTPHEKDVLARVLYKEEILNFPTPTAADTEGGAVKNVEISEKGSFSRKNKKGVRYGVKLKDAIIHLHKEEEKILNFPTPSVYQDRTSIKELLRLKKENPKLFEKRITTLPANIKMREINKLPKEEQNKILKDKITEMENLESKPLKSLKMNPDWIEWLMGYPIKWTDIRIEYKDLEIQSYHKSHILLEED